MSRTLGLGWLADSIVLTLRMLTAFLQTYWPKNIMG